MITSLGLEAKSGTKKLKKARYAIINISKKYLSRIIKDCKKLPYKSYERSRPKHKLTESYFYLSIHILKCMMRDDSLSLHVYPVITKMTVTKQIHISHVCSTENIKS